MIKKYSVLMSIYEKENPIFLQQSLESMINQTIKPDEIVVVKDGKLTLELNQVLESFQRNHPDMLKIVSLEKNVGLGKALDYGIKYCNNQLIARMDSDDISVSNRCELQLNLFNSKPELSIVGTMIDEFYDTPNNIISSRIVPVDNEEIHRFMKRRSPFNHPTVMYKKEAVIAAGGYGKMNRKQDLDLFSRMLNNGCVAENINESLLLFRSNNDSFKRRKSWSYCRSYIKVQYEILKRGHCSIYDFIYVLLGQITIFIAPLNFIKFVSKKYLRSTKITS